MAEFQEVIEQFKRLCDSANQDCSSCGLGNMSCSMKDIVDNSVEFEKRVMSWAAEHPVVYPTWIEWLQSLGVIPYLSGYVTKRDGDGNYLNGHVNVNEVAHKPIPANIAQKLEIEPKEM